MLVHRAQSAAATSISVTTTATGIYDLINTAGSTDLERAGYSPEVNGIDIVVEDGNIRYLDDGNTPTTTEGLLVETGAVLHLRHIKLDALKLISTTGTVKCGIRIGDCRPDEDDSISNGSVTLDAGGISIGAVEIKDADSNVRAGVNASGQLKVVLDGKIDSNNTTTENLNAGIAFTGTATDVLDYAIAYVNVHVHEASATDGLSVQQSVDGSDWSFTDEFTIAANAAKTFSFQLSSKWFRVIYTNGGSNQTHFDLSTTLKKGNSKPSSHRIQDSIVDDDDAELVKSVLTGKDPGGSFLNVNTTTDGNLTISDNSNGLAISSGDVTGSSVVHKFGSAPDFDTGDGEVTIWDGAEDGTAWEHMIYTYSSSADIQYISSSDNGDTVDLKIQGLDTDYNLVTQTKTLTGQTSATLDTPLRRIFRMKNSNGTSLVGHVFASTTAAGGTGVPTAANIRCVVQPENNQTEMAIYTVPAGKTAYVRSWYSSSAGANKDTNIIIRLKAREVGGVFQLKHKMAWGGDIPYQHIYSDPEKFSEKVDIEMSAELTAGGVSGAAVSAGFDIVLVDD